MTRRWLDALLCTRPGLRPARALLSPTWLFALAVLGANDHLLKGAGVLPGVFTGKLSDLAGMLVAPALLAALLGIKTRRGLLHCHIAVGLVFALINLSPACADAWSWLMGLVGFPWAITVDPTDLLALPALALGWRALVPVMAAAPAPVSSVSLSRWPTVPQAGAAAVGALLCVATSPSQPGTEGGWDGGDTIFPWISADVYLHNSHPDHDITVRVRELRQDVQIDCFNVESDPGLYFSEALFGEGVTWDIPATANVPVRQDFATSRECYAVLLTSDTFAPTILFWHASDIQPTEVEGQHDNPEQYREGAVILSADDDGVARVSGSESDIVFAQRAPSADTYVPQSDLLRVAWSTPPSSGIHEITDLELGSDGCAAFTFDGAFGSRFYLCTPLAELPFAPLQYVNVSDQGDLVVLARVAGPGEPGPIPDVRLAASRGTQLPLVTGATIAAKPLFEANIGPEPVCGTVAQPQQFNVEFGGQARSFGAGDSVVLDDGAHTLTIHGVHAERRLIVATECAEGPDQIGDDLELVYLWSDSPAP